MGSLSQISILPDELVVSVLRWLSVSDLCNAVLVCRRWRTIGEDPSLWRHYLLEINYGTKTLARTLGFHRFSKLESLLIRGFDPYNEEQMRFDASVVVRSHIKRL